MGAVTNTLSGYSEKPPRNLSIITTWLLGSKCMEVVRVYVLVSLGRVSVEKDGARQRKTGKERER